MYLVIFSVDTYPTSLRLAYLVPHETLSERLFSECHGIRLQQDQSMDIYVYTH